MMDNSNILVVEDMPAEVLGYKRFLERLKCRVTTCGRLSETKKVIKHQSFDAVFLDLDLPDGNGLELLSPLQALTPPPGVIVITGTGGVPEAVSAMKRGVFSFLTKPVDLDELEATLDKCLKMKSLNSQKQFNEQVQPAQTLFFGESPAMKKVIEMAELAAGSDTAVLLTGDTGTGKGITARWIHEHSGRSGGPFVALNCANLKGELLMSELFGYAKGAFTSAVRDRMGLIEGANGGTLFLDEIGEMDLNSQIQLLKTVEEKNFRRLGENVTRSSDFRLICATNRDLLQRVRQGSFRNDLYYRITIFPIELPALRERSGDLTGLTIHLLDELGYRHGQLSEALISFLKQHDFPGNIRELRNMLERALLFARESRLEIKHFHPVHQYQPAKETRHTWNLGIMEAETILAAYENFKGDKNRMCMALGISTASLYRKLDKLKGRLPPRS